VIVEFGKSEKRCVCASCAVTPSPDMTNGRMSIEWCMPNSAVTCGDVNAKVMVGNEKSPMESAGWSASCAGDYSTDVINGPFNTIWDLSHSAVASVDVNLQVLMRLGKTDGCIMI
jgi:hypothetical protein